MSEPSQKITPRAIGADVEVLSAFYPVPGLGVVPMNAFLLRAAQPVLVDTGLLAWSGAYLEAIRAAIDPRDLRWIWLTHADPDHVGALRAVLDEAPRAKLVTTFLGLGKLGLYGAQVAPDRVHLVNPGQRLDVGDRTLLALRPPTFDAPETTGFLDEETRALFSSDSFGGVLTEPVESAAEISATALRDGVVLWTTVDAPWLGSLDPAAYERNLAAVRSLAPSVVLSSHLPPAHGMIDTLVSHLRSARSASPFVGPDQAAFERMLAAAPPPSAPPRDAHP